MKGQNVDFTSILRLSRCRMSSCLIEINSTRALAHTRAPLRAEGKGTGRLLTSAAFCSKSSSGSGGDSDSNNKNSSRRKPKKNIGLLNLMRSALMREFVAIENVVCAEVSKYRTICFCVHCDACHVYRFSSITVPMNLCRVYLFKNVFIDTKD